MDAILGQRLRELPKDPLSIEQLEYLGEMAIASKRMTSLVDALLLSLIHI